jgi:Protein of unknown function (DUF1576)
VLLTDYFGVGGIGGGCVNAGLLTLAAALIYHWTGDRITGASVAALFLVLGFDDGGLRATVMCEKIGPSAGSRVQLSRAISGRRERPRGRRRTPTAGRTTAAPA